MRKVSKNALALAMDQAELKIREELAAKIAQIRKELPESSVSYSYTVIPSVLLQLVNQLH